MNTFTENLAAGTGQFTATDGINIWVAEEKKYDPKNPVASHYTQVVWKGTTEVGCVVQKCGAGTIFAAVRILPPTPTG